MRDAVGAAERVAHSVAEAGATDFVEAERVHGYEGGELGAREGVFVVRVLLGFGEVNEEGFDRCKGHCLGGDFGGGGVVEEFHCVVQGPYSC